MKCIMIGFIVGLFAFLYSCYDDRGNYDYTDINEITFEEIEGIDLNAWNEYIAYVDTLKCYPKFTSSMAADESNYAYEWKIIPSNADVNVVGDTINYVVDTTRNLIWPVALDAGTYRCFYNVTDKASGLRFTQKFYLRISTLTSEGWMVLCEQDGKPRMDMVVNMSENEDIIARDIWQESDFDPGKPLQLIYSWYVTDPPGTVTLLVTDKGTYMADEDDLHVGEDNNLRWMYGSQPEHVNVRASGIAQYDTDYDTWDYYPLYWTLVDDKGDVYLNTVNELGGLFGYPVNEIDGERFEAAPFVGEAYRYMRQTEESVQVTMLYDATNQRFLEIRAGAGKPSVMTFSGTTLFSAEQPGKDMIHMESTCNNGLVYSILKDEVGDLWYYGITLGNLGVNTQERYGKLEGPEIENAKLFAFHPTLPWMFYAVENKIYRVDLSESNPKEPEVVAEFPGETITVLKFNPFYAWIAYQNWQDARNLWLIVGSNVNDADESECGIMRAYEFENQWDFPASLIKEHKNLGHIISIAYKEATW